MPRRSKAYNEGMARFGQDLAASVARTAAEVQKRELKEGRQEVTENIDWLVNIPKELQNAGLDTINAPTINPERPRAWTIAYNPTERKLVVVFRDNTWWEYRDVPVSLWNGLRQSGSTGKYLRASGLDSWPDMGPADMSGFSAGAKEQISQTAQIASRLKGTMDSINKKNIDNIDLRSVTAKELFNDLL